jgi:hypothetical protein
MGAAVTVFLRVALQVLAGVGVGSVLDKLIADKLPAYPGNFPDNVNPTKPGFNPIRLIVLIVVMAISVMLLAFIGKKFKIKLLK